MGASGWSYYTPYTEDRAQALQDLRQRVFEEGEYQQFWLAAISFPEEKLLEYFGTARPTRAMVEKVDAENALCGFLGRWQAIFVILYQEGLPSEMYFTGHSGG